MKHHVFAAAMGFLTAAVIVPGGEAQAAGADPTGYWVKPDSERNAKIQVTRCGKGGAQLCSNIVWLEDPNDSRGRPLHDVRNQVPSMRDRPILGLPLFTGMTRTGPTTWTGKIYNPEDGNTYSATLTMVSQKQIVLKGCKAWLLCGERTWLRTSPPPQPEPEEQLIEAKAEPETQPAQPTQAAAAAIPSAIPAATRQSASVDPIEAAEEPQVTEPAIEMASTAQPPVEHAVRPGYGFLNVSTTATPSDKLSGENVPSMFTMADPIEEAEVAPQTAAVQSKEPAPLPAPKPKTTTAAAQATAAAMPQAMPAQPGRSAVTLVPVGTAQQAALAAQPEGVETSEEVAPAPLTRRERRALRRQQRQLLPWLQ